MQQIAYHILCLYDCTLLVYNCRIDKDGNLMIDWNEWREHFSLQPFDTTDNLLVFWRNSVVSVPFKGEHSICFAWLLYYTYWCIVYLVQID